MEQKNKGLRNISIVLVCAMVGMSLGIMFGVRLGLTSVQVGIRNDVKSLKIKIDDVNDSHILCPPSFKLNDSDSDFDSDIEPRHQVKAEKLPPITL